MIYNQPCEPRRVILFSLIIIFSISHFQCNKPPVVPKPPSVYIVGNTDANPDGDNVLSAILWVDGKPSILSKGVYKHTYSGSVFATGKDIYVAGTSDDASNTTATLWKNGTASYLSSNNDNTLGYQVSVSSNNVFVLGTNTGGDWRTIIWKNGTPSYTYNDLEGGTSHMFFQGTDMFVSGIYKSAGNYLPAVYKNNDLTILNVPGSYTVTDPISVYANGSDIFVAGTIRNNSRQRAVLWKNGLLSYLDSAYHSSVSKISGNGADIYIAGQTQEQNGTSQHLVWKNGQRMFITNDVNIGFHSIFIFEKDIYLAGGDFQKQPSKAMMYKNTKMTYLKSWPSLQLACYANDVFVTR